MQSTSKCSSHSVVLGAALTLPCACQSTSPCSPPPPESLDLVEFNLNSSTCAGRAELPSLLTSAVKGNDANDSTANRGDHEWGRVSSPPASQSTQLVRRCRWQILFEIVLPSVATVVSLEEAIASSGMGDGANRRRSGCCTCHTVVDISSGNLASASVRRSGRRLMDGIRSATSRSP